MKKAEGKTGVRVVDRGFPCLGTGTITEVLKTVFRVNFK